MVQHQIHIPVMTKEILEGFQPLICAQGDLAYLDGTFGRGGHAKAVLQMSPNIKVTALDRDPQAIEYGKAQFSSEIQSGKLQLLQASFYDIEKLNLGLFDVILLDLGVSSPQLDDSDRGFSFYGSGPLDMRMDLSQELTAADLVNGLSEKDLCLLFQRLGEILRPHRVVRAIVHDRKTKPFQTTQQLAGLIERVDGWRKKGFHPATQYFLALRLRVNNELEGLLSSLVPLILRLKPKGRLAVLTFHSLEDRIVKNTFRQQGNLGKVVYKKAIQPSREEILSNPRSRSAKLRFFERGEFEVNHSAIS